MECDLELLHRLLFTVSGGSMCPPVCVSGYHGVCFSTLVYFFMSVCFLSNF